MARRMRVIPLRLLPAAFAAAVLVFATEPCAHAQSVSGVRGLNGGVGVLFSLVGPGSMYVDNQGTQGFLYPNGTFESYNFRIMGGQAWSGAIQTMGPQLSVSLIQGVNQGVPSPTVFVSPPRDLPPLPPVPAVDAVTLAPLESLTLPPIP